MATRQFDAEVARTLEAILDAEISPELVPAQAAKSAQSTEAVVGPYELQDFNLYYTLRFGFRFKDCIPCLACLEGCSPWQLAAGISAREAAHS